MSKDFNVRSLINVFRLTDEQLAEWKKTIDDLCKVNMDKTLLVRNKDTQLLTVNLDQQVCLLVAHQKVSSYTPLACNSSNKFTC